MLEKIKEILGSIRFWIVTLTAILALLQALSNGTLSADIIFDTLQIWLATVVGIGTLDSVATRFGTIQTPEKLTGKKK